MRKGPKPEQRLPFAPLEAIVRAEWQGSADRWRHERTAADVALRLHLKVSAVHRYRRHGVPLSMADALAIPPGPAPGDRLVRRVVRGGGVTPRIGIGVERWVSLRRDDPAFRAWSDGIQPALHNTTELVALNESLRVWRSTNLDRRRWRTTGLRWTDVPRYHKVVHTPPARPEWLAVLA